MESVGRYSHSECAAPDGVPSYDFDKFSPPSQQQLDAMFNKSPMRHVQNVVTPTLLLLGGKDRRVPMCQGIEYYHALRSAHAAAAAARDVPVKCLVFPEDTHAIDSPASEACAWGAIREWFDVHCV